MSRVLMLTRELPYPPNAGDRIVTSGFVRALAGRGHEVHVLSYARDGDGPAADALESHCASVVTVPPSSSSLPAPVRKALRAARGRSDVMATFGSSRFAGATAARIRELSPAVVVAQHPYMGQCFLDGAVEAALAATGARPVTSAHVVEYAAHRRQYRVADDLRSRAALAAEVPRLRREELAVYERSDRTLVLGREDRDALAGRVSSPVRLQRVGLDVDAYEPADRARAPRPTGDGDGAGRDGRMANGGRRAGEDVRRTGDGGRRTSHGDRLLFFGSYDWFPNADAVRFLCERVFPEIRTARGDAALVIAGRGAGDDIAAYGAREGIAFVGEVDDLADRVRRAAAVVAPLRVGGGTRIKLLESMAWGAPVVTTPAGAEGIEATPGDDLAVGRDVRDFAARTVRLLERPDERARLAANARETVERRYSIPAVAGALERNLGLA